MGGAAYPRGAVATRFRLRLMNALLYAPISDMQVFCTAASFCEQKCTTMAASLPENLKNPNHRLGYCGIQNALVNLDISSLH